MADRPGLAAFDFDGTITQRDTLAGFLAAVAGRRGLAQAMGVDLVDMAKSIRDDLTRDETKERILGRVLRGRTDEELRAAGVAYARTLPARFRAPTIERLRWHQRQGHATVIVSASLVYYLEPLADTLGIDAVLGVEMELGADGRATGRLARPNVRAAEKARRLSEWLAAQPPQRRSPELWAYGNSSGDDELLGMADHPTWVGKRANRSR